MGDEDVLLTAFVDFRTRPAGPIGVQIPGRLLLLGVASRQHLNEGSNAN
jgi:hypothetical protein